MEQISHNSSFIFYTSGFELLFFVLCDILVSDAAFLISCISFWRLGRISSAIFPHVFAQFLLMAGPGTKVQMQMIVSNPTNSYGSYNVGVLADSATLT